MPSRAKGVSTIILNSLFTKLTEYGSLEPRFDIGIVVLLPQFSKLRRLHLVKS